MDKLKKLQEIELNMLREVIKILDKYNLRYYMLGGTLLGAVRHRGFIPWDDDVDLGMPRKDYEKFIKIAKRFRGRYQLCSYQNKKGFKLIAKIIDTRYEFLDNEYANERWVNPWIDIFPLDGVPDGKVDFFFWKIICQFSCKCFTFSMADKIFNVDKMDEKKKNNKLIKLCVKSKVYKLFSSEFFWTMLNKELKKHDFDKCERVINFCGFWRFKEMFPKSVYDEVAEYDFEGLKLKGPADYDFVLSQMYGDYMTSPPDADKKHHNTIYESLRKVK